MRKSAIGLVVAGVAASLVLSACASDKKKTTPRRQLVVDPQRQPVLQWQQQATGRRTGRQGCQGRIILPDTKSSQRWVTADPDALKAACKTIQPQLATSRTRRAPRRR